MEKKIYFLSPLKAEVYKQGHEKADEICDGQELLEYQNEIRKAVEESKLWTGPNLMEYYGERDSVREKVKSLEVTVVEYKGELKGCAVATVTQGLDQQELEQLKDYLTGQYSDGWGEGFEHDLIQSGNVQMYVNFWNRSEFHFDVLKEVNSMDQERPELKMRIDLNGPGGNIFFVQGKAARALREAGRMQEAEEMQMRVEQCGSYYSALDIVNEYVRIEPDYRTQLRLKSEKKKTDRER